MPLYMIRNDITKVTADAIVNTCNPKPIYAGGTDSAIYHAAGAEQLLEARKAIGDIDPGNIGVTPAFNLPAKYIIHASGPIWRGGNCGEADILRDCYMKSMAKAVALKCKSIAFPLMASGTYGFPNDQALQIALNSIMTFLMGNELKVYMVIFSDRTYQLSSAIFPHIDSYIESHMVAQKLVEEYMVDLEYYDELTAEEKEQLIRRRFEITEQKGTEPKAAEQKITRPKTGKQGTKPSAATSIWKTDAPAKKAGKNSAIDAAISASSGSFHDKLIQLMNESGMTNKEIYTAANFDRKLINSWMRHRNRMPNKKNILAVCIALKLDLEETNDLLARASKSLNPHDKLDLAVEAFIKNKDYDIGKINFYLFENHLDTLGTKEKKAKEDA